VRTPQNHFDGAAIETAHWKFLGGIHLGLSVNQCLGMPLCRSTRTLIVAAPLRAVELRHRLTESPVIMRNVS
jgi:hypothetical protein